MELRQLEYFVAVAEEGGFTKAAARVHVAQPGVSAQIRRLEQELGETLFDRSGRSVQLTGVGAAFLPYARSALSSVDGARLAVDELAGLVRGRVSVGMVTSCGVLELPDALARFHREHPGVEISLGEDNSDRLLEGVESGRLDLAFVGIATDAPAGISVQDVIDDRLFAAVHPADALAGTASVELAELSRLPLVSLPLGTGLRSALDDACDRAGLTPRIAFEASSLMMVSALAARQLGVAILPESVATADGSELHPIAVTEPEIRSRLALVWRTDGPISPAARELIAVAREAMGPAPTGARS